jgi:hypothetical protein
MKTQFLLPCFTLALSAAMPALQAQTVSHYPAGAEGIKAATLPPPGLYLRDYNFGYFATDFPIGGPPNFESLDAYIQAPRVIYMSEWKVLGANFGADVIIPIGWQQMKADLPDPLAITPPGVPAPTIHTVFRDFGIGDILLEPVLLGWHGKQWDAAFAYAWWVPSGNYDQMNPASIGKGYWSQMFTFGATYYFDAEKTWAASLLNRYEFNQPNLDTGLRGGQMLTSEWGISKNLTKTIEVGLVGYYQQQTTDDSGPGSTDYHQHVVGLGPEVSAVCPKLGLITSLRYVRELESAYRPEGNLLTLTLTKRL